MGKQAARTGGPISFSNANFSPLIDFKNKIEEEDDQDRHEFNWSNRDLAQLRRDRNSVLKSEQKSINDQ